MIGRKTQNVNIENEYKEIPVKPSLYTMMVVVAVVAAPLGWLNLKIGAEGSKIADTSQYEELVSTVDRDVRSIRNILANAHVDGRTLKGSLTPVPTLITPDILPTNMDEAAMQNSSKLNIKINGIYKSNTNPADSIVTIDGESYKEGDMIQGHRIIEIRQTEVVFEDPMGGKVVKYLYEFLDTPKKKKR